ncbi:MAG: hypothetical protein ACKOEO_08670, partial [Planctomycetaceae bacterium]
HHATTGVNGERVNVVRKVVASILPNPEPRRHTDPGNFFLVSQYTDAKRQRQHTPQNQPQSVQ